MYRLNLVKFAPLVGMLLWKGTNLTQLRTQIQGEQFQSFVADPRMDHFTVVAKLPGLIMKARLPVTLLRYKFLICSFLMLMQTNYNYNNTIYMIKEVRYVSIQRHRQHRSHS